jgi:hypothetical protein
VDEVPHPNPGDSCDGGMFQHLATELRCAKWSSSHFGSAAVFISKAYMCYFVVASSDLLGRSHEKDNSFSFRPASGDATRFSIQFMNHLDDLGTEGMHWIAKQTSPYSRELHYITQPTGRTSTDGEQRSICWITEQILHLNSCAAILIGTVYAFAKSCGNQDAKGRAGMA